MPKYKSILKLSKRSIRRHLFKNKRTAENTLHYDNSEDITIPEIEVRNDNCIITGEGVQEVPSNVGSEGDTSTAAEFLSNFENENVEEFPSNLESEGNNDTSFEYGRNILKFLQLWATRNNIKANAVNELLIALRLNGFDNLPKDSRTLLSTPSSREMLECPPGEYCYIGLNKYLVFLLLGVTYLPEKIVFDFNIDGVPISKSNHDSFWLILAKCFNINKPNIFIISIYHGSNKPNDFNVFLKPFVDEIKELMKNGYIFNGKKISVEIRAFICDAPARSGVLGTKSHAAYSGCLKCSTEGEFIRNRMTYPIENIRLRTNESFRQKSDENHHNYVSILEELDIDMIRQFPLEYLHLVCLGVVKKLLKMWVNGETSSLLSSNDVKKISNMLKKISKTQPNDFQRQIRPLTELSYFKGSEFRVFLLYSGPFVLKNVLPENKYNHFLLLHTAILILCSDTLSQTKADLAHNLLTEFVNGMAQIYGRHHLTYNMHCLIHLTDDVKQFGTLDKFSAFPFESYMFSVKNMLRKPNQPLAQLFNRLFEKNNIQTTEASKQIDYPILKQVCNENGKQVYKKIILKNFELSSTEKNCWFLGKNKDIIRLKHIEVIRGKIFVAGNKCLNIGNFYDIPINSTRFDICKADFVDTTQYMWPYGFIDKKLFAMLDEDNKYVFFPILHANNLCEVENVLNYRDN